MKKHHTTVLARKNSIPQIKTPAALIFAFAAVSLFLSCPPPTDTDPVVYSVGDTGPAGGVIFYDDEADGNDDISGARYLEAWTSNEGELQWKTSQTATAGTSSDFGSGYENTYTAMAGADYPAAETARNATHGGYNDWFIPSYDELQLVYTLRDTIGGFNNNWYWFSSEWEMNSSMGRTVQFFNGSPVSNAKTSDLTVRLIRAF
jgi:hypothetical protein